MYVFIDETGNTGPNMFDSAQPFFMSMALMSKVDFNACYEREFCSLLKTCGLKDMHARCMSFAQYEKACGKLPDILRNNEISFTYTYIDKVTYVTTILFDSIFDPGNNAAVPWSAYGVETLRKVLLLNFIALIRDDNSLLEMFWSKCLFEKKSSNAKPNFLKVCEQLQEKLKCSNFDKRTHQIFSESFAWMQEFPDEVDYHICTNEDRFRYLPNATFLGGLMANIDSQWQAWKTTHCTVQHDRQSEFQSALEFMYKITSSEDTPKFLEYPLSKTPKRLQALVQSTWTFIPSANSYGVQTTDICLSVLAKAMKKKPLSLNEIKLHQFILDNMHSDFGLTYELLATEVMLQCNAMMNADISENVLNKGKEIVAEGECIRKEIMRNHREENSKLLS